MPRCVAHLKPLPGAAATAPTILDDQGKRNLDSTGSLEAIVAALRISGLILFNKFLAAASLRRINPIAF